MLIHLFTFLFVLGSDSTATYLKMLQDRWEGEDEEEVKDNWDDSDEEEDQSKSVETAVVPKKKTLKQKIAEKEEEARRKKEEKLLANRKLTPEEELAEKLKRQKLQEESDLKLAMETFGVGESTAVEVTGLDSAQLVNKESFDGFRRLLVKKLNGTQSTRGYVTFLEELFRDLSIPLEADDMKSISSSLTAMYNEKLKAQRVSYRVCFTFFSFFDFFLN